MKKLTLLKAGLIAVFLVLTGIIYSCQRAVKEQPGSPLGTPITAEENNRTVPLTDSSEDTDNNMEEDTGVKEKEPAKSQETVKQKWYIHVCGAVKNPGVYEVEEGARIFEAVRIAGGFTEEADVNYINQAGSVQDGEQIYIPTVKEVKEDGLEKAFPDSREAVKADTGVKAEGRININRAGREELLSLPGIGEAKADSIISYRTTHGGFQSVEELKNVDGIKDGVFNKLKDMVTAE